MNYAPSEENMADDFTKPMTKGKSSTLLKNIMLIQQSLLKQNFILFHCDCFGTVW